MLQVHSEGFFNNAIYENESESESDDEVEENYFGKKKIIFPCLTLSLNYSTQLPIGSVRGRALAIRTGGCEPSHSKDVKNRS